MNRRSHSTKTYLVVAVLFAVLLSCSAAVAGAQPTNANSTQTQHAKLRKIVFALPLPPNLSLAGYVVTQKKGFWAQQGLNVQFAPGTTGIEQVGLLVAGRAQFASFDVLGQCAVLRSRAIVMLGVYVYEPRTFLQVFGLADKNFRSNADLKGKKIGVTSLQSGTVITAKAALAEAGLSADDAQLVPVGTSAIAALLSGQVDVLSQYDLVSAAVQAKGYSLFQFDLGSYKDVPGNTVFTTPSYARSDPDVVRRFVAGLAQGEAWIAAHPDQATKIVMDALPEQALDKALATAQIKGRISYYTRAKNKPYGWFDLKKYQQGVNAVGALGALPGPCPNLTSLWTNEFVMWAAKTAKAMVKAKP